MNLGGDNIDCQWRVFGVQRIVMNTVNPPSSNDLDACIYLNVNNRHNICPLWSGSERKNLTPQLGNESGTNKAWSIQPTELLGNQCFPSSYH